MVIRTGRDALYFQEDGLFALPKAYILIAFLAIPQAMMVLRMLRAIGGRAMRVILLLLVAALAGLFYAVAEPGGGLLMTAFFVAIPLLFSVLFSMVWLLGAELYEDAGKKAVARAYSRLGAASIVGGVAGGALARLAGPIVGPRMLALIGAGLILGTLVWVALAHRRFPLQPLTGESDEEPASESDDRSIFTRPHVPLLLAIAMTASLSGIFIEFQFYLTAATSGGSSEDMTIFFANVYLVLNAASLVLQLFVTPRLQSWLGLSGSLMVLPLALSSGAAVAVATASGMARAALRIAEGGLKSGVHRSLWEQAFLIFPRAIRPSAKVVVDGLGARIAEGLAAFVLYVWLVTFVAGGDVAGANISWVSVALIGSTLVWLGLTRVLRRRLKDTGVVTLEPEPRAPLPDF